MIRIEKRQGVPAWGSLLVFGGALVFCLVVSGLLLLLTGKPPVGGLYSLLSGGFGSGWAVEDTVRKSVPIFLAALGVAVAFRMQVWNIGAEGQFGLGAIGATGVALALAGMPAVVLLPCMFLGAAVLGGAWAWVPAMLRNRLGVNEIISTLMLNYIAFALVEYLVYGPWKDPDSFGFPVTAQFTAGALLPTLPGTNLNAGVVVCVVAGALVHVLFSRTRIGYDLRVGGYGERLANYAGLDYRFLVVFAMCVSGALAGFAGLVEVTSLGRLQASVMVGYGFTAVIVAWVAGLNPLAIGLVSVLLAGLRVGVENLQLDLQVPVAFGHVLEGIILLSVLAGGFFNRYRFRLR